MDGQRIEWRELNDQVQIAVRDGHGLAIVYTSEVTYGEDDKTAREFWWLPVDAPNEPEVLFGVSEGVDGWNSRWDRARSWVELELSRRWDGA